MIPICKAKRIDNGEWVEGYVIYDQFTKECEIMRAIKKDAPMSLDRDTIWLWDKVHPETVCMWTGLEDKNGVKIFEGDRVRNRRSGHVQVVQWQEDIASFMLVEPDDLKEKAEPRDSLIATERRYEVIGSIHDKDTRCRPRQKGKA